MYLITLQKSLGGETNRGSGDSRDDQSVVARVVSSEISLGKFPEIYSNLPGNLLNNFFTL